MKSYIGKTITYFAIFSALIIAGPSVKGAVKSHLTKDTTAMQRYPAQPNDISPLLIGEHIPTVNIPAADGKLFDLNASVAQKPTILIFYRGGWCPFCNKEKVK